MARIAIVGPGAVGGVVAAWLGHTGRHEVALCARRPLGALQVETPSGALTAQPSVLTEPAKATPADWVLICTKAYDAEGAAAWLPGFIAKGAPVAVLQNGVEHRERFARWLPPERILPVMVDIPSERTDPTHIRQRGPGVLIVPDDAPGRDFVALFAGTALNVSTTPDFKSAVWRKLCFNAAGVLNALLLQPARAFHDEDVAGLGRAIVREVIAVGRAEGAVLDENLPDIVMQNYRKAPPDSMNSLHADQAAGRPTEIDARNGVIVRLGRKHGIPTPCNRMAVALIQAAARFRP